MRITLDGTPIDYHERGDGPPLLLLPGGAGHAGVFDGLAAHLTDHYRVVAMSSRLVSARPDGDQHPKVYAEDVLGLIEALFDEPPAVFAFSAGAITTLDLLARHPERVRLAVVHEPPVVSLLPDADRHRAALEAVRAAARTGDLDEAARLMTDAMTAPEPGAATPELRHPGDWLDGYAETSPEPPTPELLELFARLGELQPLFLEHVLVPFTSADVDVAALAAAGPQLVPVAGIDSRGQLPYRAAAALASRLGLPLTEFPGGHLGPVERPTQFAAALRALLG
ncbi:alpha/beta fold hydrolase [Amycolatopsis thermoflava]|uniref:Pimeloyl-ACP methyl ester carboxylesterase n=1 Tax=Amycolatopsis thermoflava TaxID=84480 RepID=A0A3N2H017_9PSEU|nr:alpha/beta hydrolase [Amycolatopsis thermoflava]ROS42256.1 pimeloyl-ACP methyl ester carboxylesterase [Amycolatopsis thermoflava]